jgi:rSAM-associated Gly-rich repeat protein
MSANKRIAKVLAMLLPTGVLGISSALAATQVRPEPNPTATGLTPTHVADLLADIRKAVSGMDVINAAKSGPMVMLAEWLNVGGGVGWRNGGWGNGGGWRNGGWGNGGNWGNGGWHNAGWGNGGWHNWGNGGWHNFWHNW